MSAVQKEEEIKIHKDIYDEVEAAKSRFMEAALAIHPLGIVQNNPKTSLLSAFLLGFGAERSRKYAKSLSIVPIALQMAQLLLKSLLKK